MPRSIGPLFAAFDIFLRATNLRQLLQGRQVQALHIHILRNGTRRRSRRGRKPFRGKNKGGRGGGGGGRDTRTEPWSTIERKNELFESYYRMGGFLDEAEFEEMWKALQADLPNSFRFTGTKSDALAVREIFKQRYVPAIASKHFEGKPVSPPEPVAAFPDELVWHMKTHKKIIRRHAPFADFQKFLVAEAASGNISRQEVVSSKSAQLAEMIHGDEEERVQRVANGESVDLSTDGDYSDDGRSTGLLIANDSDYKRAGIQGGKKQYLKYDRILADVPCSGDGTARKNPNVWQKWTPKDGLGLHGLQLRILFRGLQMLKKGGRMVYSTCSMNPVENEAVVAAAIEACGGNAKVKLVDCSDHLPNLKRKPGLNSWKVLDTSSARAKYETEEPERQFSTKVTPSCFPPIAKSEQERIPLEHCIRVYPHLQDTGGFFIAILEKLDDIKIAQIQSPETLNKGDRQQAETTTDSSVPTPAENVIEADATKTDTADDASDISAPLKRKLEEPEDTEAPKKVKTDDVAENGAASAPATESATNGSSTQSVVSKGASLKPENQNQAKEYFEYLSPDDATIASILDFFGIDERFPRDRFMVKNKEASPSTKSTTPLPLRKPSSRKTRTAA
ncbi:hypothetical protein J3E74DRAFT_423840 [Bipolaris maydis]|nr:hypothetical protein J3E74DRAFT_423840 [Bipolaris maydis]